MVKDPKTIGRQRKIGDLLLLANVLMALLVLNVLAQDYFFRIDLTADKRYTLNEASKNLLRDLNETVYVDVYLDGEVPAGFKRLQRSIEQTLEQFRNYAGGNIQYRFIDPATAVSPAARNEFYQSLADKGIQPTNIFDTEEGRRVEKLVFPGAVISYGGREKGVMLLGGSAGASAEEKLNQSVEEVEYALMRTISALTRQEKPAIGLIASPADSFELSGIRQLLAHGYELSTVQPDQSLAGYDAILLVKPFRTFTDQELYRLDQFVMQGGRLLAFLDASNANMQGAGAEGMLAVPVNTRLNELFFRYGLRLNTNLLQDLNSGGYPLVVGNMGNNPQIQMVRWPFYPILNNYADHPVVRNLDASLGRFMSTLDTVMAEGITKQPLIFSSAYARTFTLPLQISLNDLRKDFQPEAYNKGPLAVAYMLEGRFTSLFKNRFLPEGIAKAGFIPDGQPAKVLVVADGDFVLSSQNPQNGEPLPLGEVAFQQQGFANGQFLLNALEYMLNEDGLILARNKEIAIRPLDPVKLEEERTFWQLINIGLPLLLIVLLGIGHTAWRKYQYTRF